MNKFHKDFSTVSMLNDWVCFVIQLYNLNPDMFGIIKEYQEDLRLSNLTTKFEISTTEKRVFIKWEIIFEFFKSGYI